MQLFAWSLDKNAAAIGGASKPLSTVFSVVYPIWKVAAAVAVVEIEAAVIEIAVVAVVEIKTTGKEAASVAVVKIKTAVIEVVAQGLVEMVAEMATTVD